MIRSLLKTSLVAGAALFGAQTAQASLYEINANGSVGLLNIDQTCRTGTLEFAGATLETLTNLYCSQYGNELRIRFDRPQARQVYDGVGTIYGFSGTFYGYNGSSSQFSAQLATPQNLRANLELNINTSEGILSIEKGCTSGSINFLRNNNSTERIENLRCYSLGTGLNGYGESTKITFSRPNARQTYMLELQRQQVRGSMKALNGQRADVTGSRIQLNRVLDGASFDILAGSSRGMLNIHHGSQSGEIIFNSYGGSAPEAISEVYSYLRLSDRAQVLRFSRPNARQSYVGILRGREITGTAKSLNGSQFSWSGYLMGMGQPPIGQPPIGHPPQPYPPQPPIGHPPQPPHHPQPPYPQPPAPPSQCPPGTVFDPNLGRCVSVVTPPPPPPVFVCTIHSFTVKANNRETAIQQVLQQCAQGSGGYVCARSQVRCSPY